MNSAFLNSAQASGKNAGFASSLKFLQSVSCLGKTTFLGSMISSSIIQLRSSLIVEISSLMVPTANPSVGVFHLPLVLTLR